MNTEKVEKFCTTCALNLPLEVYNKLKNHAQENQRAISRQIAYILIEYFKKKHEK